MGARLSLFPTPDNPARLYVRACRHVPDPATLTVRVIVDDYGGSRPPGYVACEPVQLALPEAEQWYHTELTVRAEPVRLAMATGKLIVRGAAGGHPVRADVPLRMGRGAIAFMQRRSVRLPGGPQTVDIACLENPYLRAEIVPELGCVSALIPHAVAENLLAEGDDVLGLWWQGAGPWHHEAQSPCGSVVGTTLTATHQGAKLRMQVTLSESEGGLRVTLDGGDSRCAPGPVMLATNLGPDTRVVLSGGGLQESVIPGAPPQLFGFARKATLQAEVQDVAPRTRLLVAAQGASLSGLQVGAVSHRYCYLAFSTGAAPPGVLQFILAPSAATTP